MAKIKESLLKGILAGACIAIGGTAFLMIDNKVVGALFFTIGLFVICTQGFNLFTGKLCYIFQNDKSYAFNLIPIYIGNLIGTSFVALLELLTRNGVTLQEKAILLCNTKLNDNLLSILVLSFFCNILVYIAVDGFNNNPHEVGKYLSLFLGIATFILCGFEHCVANMYYFAVANMWSGKTILYLLVMSAGNFMGGISIPLMKILINKVKETK